MKYGHDGSPRVETRFQLGIQTTQKSQGLIHPVEASKLDQIRNRAHIVDPSGPPGFGVCGSAFVGPCLGHGLCLCIGRLETIRSWEHPAVLSGLIDSLRQEKE